MYNDGGEKKNERRWINAKRYKDNGAPNGGMTDKAEAVRLL